MTLGRPSAMLGVDYDNDSWRDNAACRGTFDLMFDEDSQAAALALCDLCPVFDQCDTYAAEYGPPSGIWAGKDEKTRNKGNRRRWYR